MLTRLATALGFAGASYAALGGIDALAARYSGAPVRWWRAAACGAVANAISNTVGFSAVSGSAVRLRFWGRWGATGAQAALGSTFALVSLWVGMTGAMTLVHGGPAGVIGWAGTLLIAAYVGWAAVGTRWPAHRLLRLRPPPIALALGQIALASLDWLLAAAVLFVILPAHTISYPAFATIFFGATVAGMLSHLPGGIGVFDAAMVAALDGRLPRASLLGALMTYRMIYQGLPAAIGFTALGLSERRTFATARDWTLRRMATGARWITARVPLIVAAITFAAGVVLLASAATPSLAPRVKWLDGLLPLGVIELSHFLSVVAGVTLILVARGVQQRLAAAWELVVGVMIVGVAASLLKGLDYEEATLLSVALALVVASRPHFWRRSAILSEPLPRGAVVAALVALGGMAVLGFASYETVRYHNDLWLQFTATGDASRFLRGLAGAVLTAGVFGVARLMHPARHEPVTPSDEQRATLNALMQSSARSGANLAFLGDKDVLLAEDGTGFLMYAVKGRSWIALGDPVGSPATRRELAWRFSVLARERGGQPAFYEVSPEMLSVYVELGLRVIKLGEEARVPLEGFTLAGSSMRKFRTTVRQFERDGLRAEILAPGEAHAVIDELREISDLWLAEKGHREKTFSVGRFDPGYLARFPIILVRNDAEILAFANVWTSRANSELSVDLMRYRPGRHNGIMDFLFIEAMQYGAREGYRWFNLGMAPLSGLENRRGAPFWSRAGALVFSHGETFYHFQGLRRYKEKFTPVWEPRYLAVPNSLALPGTLANVTLLISGGLAGLVPR